MFNRMEAVPTYDVIALIRGNEKYLFIYDNESRAETLRTFGRFASNPELSFSWYDAAEMCQKVRKKETKNANR
jgi:hypothetical protein